MDASATSWERPLGKGDVLFGEIQDRDDELVALERLVADAAIGPAGLRFEGEAGIGKTTLWRAGVTRALERGYRVLHCRPSETEAKVALTAFSDLLADVTDETLSLLPDQQARALQGALLRSDATPRPLRRTLMLGFQGIVHALSRAQPLIVAIDDIQWVDRASAQIFAFAMRRLSGDPIGLLTTKRTDTATGYVGGSSGELLDLDESNPDTRMQRIQLGAMNITDIGRMILARVGTPLPRHLLMKVHGASRGNPLLALEIAQEISHRDLPFTIGEELPVPDQIARLFATRIAGVPARAREALLVAATMLDRKTAVIVASVDGMTFADLDPLIEAGILEPDGDALRFTHPLFASAVTAAASPEQRRRAHQRLANLVVDPEERAHHLAHSTPRPDRTIATMIERAAGTAHSHGASEAASELAEGARSLTPREDRADLRRRTILAADYHLVSGELPQARSLLEGLLDSAAPGVARAEAMWRLGRLRCETDSVPAALDLMTRALAEARDDSSLKAVILVDLAAAAAMAGHDATALEHATAAVAVTEEDLNDETLLVEALSIFCVTSCLAGRGISPAIDRALAIDERTKTARSVRGPSFVAAHLLLWSDDVEGARRCIEATYERSRTHGDEAAIPQYLFLLSEIEYRSGRFELAAAHAEEGSTIAAGAGAQTLHALGLWSLASACAALGRIEEAQQAAKEGIALAEETGATAVRLRHFATLGALAVSLGQAEEAHQMLGPVCDAWAASAGFEPGASRFVTDDVEALIALGELERARSLLDRFEEKAIDLHRVWARAAAARCRALMRSADEDIPGATARATEALALCRGLDQPLETGRTLLVDGTISRRGKRWRRAKTSLARACATFDEIGATLWAERARQELSRVGGRPSTPLELTETERKVATLIATGLSTKATAEALFLSAKSVEANLTKIYRKLNVHTRAGLASKLLGSQGDTGHFL